MHKNWIRLIFPIFLITTFITGSSKVYGDVPGETPEQAMEDIQSFWFLRLQRFRYSPTSPAAVLKAYYLEKGNFISIKPGNNRLDVVSNEEREGSVIVRFENRHFVIDIPGAIRVYEMVHWDARAGEATWKDSLGQVETPSGTFRIEEWPIHLSYQPPYGRVLVFTSIKERPTSIRSFHRFPVNLAYRLKARLIREPSERVVAIETSRGLQSPMKQVGWLEFVYRFKTYRLAAFVEDGKNEDELFIIYRDKTSGKETYPIGRYLPANRLNGQFYILDFNKSYLPLCAYSHAYNCPIPPRSNHLPFPVRAGEINPPPDYKPPARDGDEGKE